MSVQLVSDESDRLGTFAPPPITSFDITVAGGEREPLLLYVVCGDAEFVHRGTARQLTSGAALLVAPGVAFRLHASPGAVVIPVFSREWAVPHDAGPVTVLPLGLAWTEWVAHQFGRSLGYLRGDADGAPLTGDALPRRLGGDQRDDVSAPPMPRSAGAVRVARAIRTSPGTAQSLPRLAALGHVGVRTLQDQFTRETGRSLSRWRRETRVDVAARHLAAGRSVGWVQQLVGFETPAGFTKAFSAVTGLSPRAYQRLHATDRRPPPAPFQLPRADAEPEQAPLVPASQTWVRVNDFHVLVWIFRGEAEITTGGQCHRLRQGDVTWLPAHVPNHVRLPAGSVLLPLGSRPAGPSFRHDEHLVRLRTRPEDEGALLATAVANYTAFHAMVHDPAAVTRAFLEQGAVGQVRLDGSTPYDVAVAQILLAFRSQQHESETLSGWARRFDLDAAALGRHFREVTAASYPDWVAQLRMSRARWYLEDDMPIRAVARRLGYASPASFGTVFRRFHGITPTQFTRRGAHSGEGLVIR